MKKLPAGVPMRLYLTQREKLLLKLKAAKERTTIAALVTHAVRARYKKDLREVVTADDLS